MKVLLIDTALAAAPLYAFLTAAGHEVWTIGNRPNDLLAQKAGDHWIQEDYRSLEDVARHIRRLGIERVVPGCTDVSIDTCLRVNQNPDLADSPETNLALTNKAAFRSHCAAQSIAAPRTVCPDDFPMRGKFVCKPVDAFSGRGITVFDGMDAHALKTAWTTAMAASPSATVLIESFIEGALHSCSAFIEKERVVFAFYVREGSSCNPFAVDTSYVVPDFPKEVAATLEQNLCALCRSLHLKDGLLHVQFILCQGEPFMIEAARRCPGDLYSLLIEYSTGFAYAAKYASYFLGVPFVAKSTMSRYVLRHTVSALTDIIFGGLQLHVPQPVRGFFPLQVAGQGLTGQQGTRAGILFSDFPSYEEMRSAYNTFLARRAYDLS
jgi:hypothetical protein